MIIEDPKIHPFFIKFDGMNYDVLEKTTKTSKDGDKQESSKLHGHYSSVEGALKRVCKLLVEKDRRLTISEYIEELTKIKNEVLNLKPREDVQQDEDQ